jgi:hypothetical protein
MHAPGLGLGALLFPGCGVLNDRISAKPLKVI